MGFIQSKRHSTLGILSGTHLYIIGFQTENVTRNIFSQVLFLSQRIIEFEYVLQHLKSISVFLFLAFIYSYMMT